MWLWWPGAPHLRVLLGHCQRRAVVAGGAADHVVVAADGQHVGVDPGAGRGPRVVGQRVLGVDQAHHDAPVVRVVAELNERRVGQAAHVEPGILEGQGAVDIVPPGVARRVQARKGLLDLGGRADVEVDVVARAVEGVAYVGVVLVHRRGVEVVPGAAVDLRAPAPPAVGWRGERGAQRGSGASGERGGGRRDNITRIRRDGIMRAAVSSRARARKGAPLKIVRK